MENSYGTDMPETQGEWQVVGIAPLQRKMECPDDRHDGNGRWGRSVGKIIRVRRYYGRVDSVCSAFFEVHSDDWEALEIEGVFHSVICEHQISD